MEEENKELINRFYKAFQKNDAKGMLACYHQDITFEDPAFGTLKGERAGAMWQMLCRNGKDLEVEYYGIEADNDKGKATWEARYTFSRTGRKIHNVVQASFTFKDGKIHTHTDKFNMRRWAGQALGFKGLLLGGTTMFRKKFQKQTNTLLNKFMAENKA